MPLQTDFDCDSLPLQRFAWARFVPFSCSSCCSCLSSSLCCSSLSRSPSAAVSSSPALTVWAPLSGSVLFMPQYIDMFICIYPSPILYMYHIYNMFAVSFVCPLLYFFVLSIRLYPLIALTAWAFYFALEIISTFCFTHTHTHEHFLKTAAAPLS